MGGDETTVVQSEGESKQGVSTVMIEGSASAVGKWVGEVEKL